MSLEEFHLFLLERAHAFKGEWASNHTLEPEKYPPEMSLEDWQEQFRAWECLEDEDG